MNSGFNILARYFKLVLLKKLLREKTSVQRILNANTCTMYRCVDIYRKVLVNRFYITQTHSHFLEETNQIVLFQEKFHCRTCAFQFLGGSTKRIFQQLNIHLLGPCGTEECNNAKIWLLVYFKRSTSQDPLGGTNYHGNEVEPQRYLHFKYMF